MRTCIKCGKKTDFYYFVKNKNLKGTVCERCWAHEKLHHYKGHER